VPQPAHTPPELRLAAFCRLFAVLYFAGALVGGIDALDPARPPVWNVLAVGLMAALGTACLVTAARPRERRHAILSVAVAQLVAVVLAAACMVSAGRSPALMAVVAIGLPLCGLTLAMYRAAAPGVHSVPAREGPPVDEPAAPKIQLKVSKS
jgi:drug/metabolite transporter (DMT)-like permease